MTADDDLTPPTGETVLVTGGAGFIGGHVASALVPTNEVRVLDDLSTGTRESVPDGATLVEGSLHDDAALRRATDGADTVFHQAAMADVARSVEAPRECHRTNVDGTLAVLERARESGARVVFASSAAVYGEPADLPLVEDAPKRPTSPYGCDKLAADRYCRLYDDLYDTEAIALRYFNVYGPAWDGEPAGGVVRAFLEQARAGDPITVHGSGEQRRDFVHVRDVVRANLLAATTDRTGEAYNVATGTSTSINELADLVGELTGENLETVHEPPREGDIERSYADVSKARADLDYEPTVTVRDGIRGLLEGTPAR